MTLKHLHGPNKRISDPQKTTQSGEVTQVFSSTYEMCSGSTFNGTSTSDQLNRQYDQREEKDAKDSIGTVLNDIEKIFDSVCQTKF